MSHRYPVLLLFVCLQFYNVKSGNAFYPGTTFFTEDNNYFLHTVEKGQTVFSIASMYYVSAEDIYQLNPQSKRFIKAGEQLKIPQESGSFIYHAIQPQETLFALSRKYRMSGEDILSVNPGLSVETFQIGKVIRIPVNRVTASVEPGNDLTTNHLLHRTSSPQFVKTIRIALLLPFGMPDSETGENTGDRMVEYYEGFLLALQALKSKGISVHLQVYDIGSDAKEIAGILKKEELQTVHLIIGGVSDEQIKTISRFSNGNGIPYVIPFTSMSNEPFNNPASYQVNMPQNILYARASAFFANQYKNCRILLVSGETGAADRLEFTGLLHSDMQEKTIPFKTVPLQRLSDAEFISDLDLHSNNVFVPDDDSPETIEKMIPPLRAIQRIHPEYQISLFGYPRWQTCSAKYPDSFFQLHAAFFSVFYANLSLPEVKDFYNTFYKWYGRSISNNFPKFGILGYDTGMYFIQAVHTYGTNFETEINRLKYKGLQTDFYFERVNNWGGFINTSLFVVNYNPDYSITQTSVR